MLQDFGFKWGRWNFFENSHGKVVADGVGGVLKRTADAHLARGHNISDAKTLFDVLIETGTRIKLIFVEENEVEEKAITLLNLH